MIGGKEILAALELIAEGKEIRAMPARLTPIEARLAELEKSLKASASSQICGAITYISQKR